MNNISEKSVRYREKLGLVFLQGPEIVFLVVLGALGGVAAGWFLIGIGALFALIPLIGFAVYCLARAPEDASILAAFRESDVRSNDSKTE